ncbi:MAG: hypothetical protein ACWGN7_00140 [Thermodesulfovibrionales bacterium]
MKILYLLKQDPDATLSTIMEVHRRNHEVTVIDLRSDSDYDQIVAQIETADKIISW